MASLTRLLIIAAWLGGCALMSRSVKTMKKVVSERQHWEEVEKVASTGAGNEVLCHDQKKQKIKLAGQVPRRNWSKVYTRKKRIKFWSKHHDPAEDWEIPTSQSRHIETLKKAQVGEKLANQDDKNFWQDLCGVMKEDVLNTYEVEGEKRGDFRGTDD